VRHALVAGALIAALAVPGVATSGWGASVTLPYKLVSSSPPTPWFNSGTVAGRLGGVPVMGGYQGTSKVGIVTLTVHKATFAYGSYTCARKSCTFAGVVAGIRVAKMRWPVNIRGTGKVVMSGFPNRRAWIAAVTNWARAHLSEDQRDKIIAEAAKIEGS
jgi:hypothetical protein